MPLDPSIAMGFRGVQIENPLEQYGRAVAIQGAQQQNALARMQMAQAERAIEEQNALRGLYQDAASPEGRVDYNQLSATAAKRGLGYLVPEIEKRHTERETQRMTREKTRLGLISTKTEQARDFLAQIDPNAPDAVDRILALHEATHADPDMDSFLRSAGATVERGRVEIARVAQGGPQAIAQYLERATTGAATLAERLRQQDLNKPVLMTRPGGGQVLVSPKGEEIYAATPAAGVAPAPRQRARQPAAAAPAAAAAAPGAPFEPGVPAAQAKAEATGRGKLLSKQYETLSEAAKIAAKTLPAIETNMAILDAGFKTGFGTEAIKAGASVLSALGVPDAEKYAARGETFLGNVNQIVLQRQLEQKGPQTEADARRITATGAQLGNTPAANRFILSVAKAQLQRDLDQRKFYNEWWRKNKTYEGAEEAWYDGEGGKSLFERSELSQYRSKTPTPAGATGKWEVVR